MAMVMVFIGFANLLMNFGFGPALIQKKEISQKDLTSVFWFNIVVGAILTALFIALAPAIATFYNESILTPMTIVLSVVFIVQSFNIVQATVLERKLDYKKYAQVKVISIFVSTGIAIVLAWRGAGVWALVVQELTRVFVQLILLWYKSRWRPDFSFEMSSLKRMFKFSAVVSLNALLEKIAFNLDNLIIGKKMGDSDLGIYTKSQALMMIPVMNIASTIGRVIFSSFSRIQDDLQALQNQYIKIITIITFLIAPVMAGLFIVSEEIVLVLFGRKWEGMIPVVRLFSLMGCFAAINAFINNVIIAKGETKILLKTTFFDKVVTICLIIGGSFWGFYGIIAGKIIASISNYFMYLFFTGKILNLSLWDQLKNLLSIYFNAIVMALSLYALGIAFVESLPGHLLQLPVYIILGASIYLALSFLNNRKLLLSLNMNYKSIIKKK